MEEASFDFRAVSLDDGASLADMRVEAMRPSLERLGRFDANRACTRFLNAFSPEHTREIVSDGVRVGFFAVRPKDGGLVLEHLYVRPSYQGRGIGAAVLHAVFADADAEGLEVRIGALLESDSNRFYLRHGFQLEQQAEFDNYYVRMPGHAT